MEPPQAPLPETRPDGDAHAAVSARAVNILSKRQDFQRASGGLRVAKPGFILQMRRRASGEAEGIRAGFTCSKKVGNAVARNRAKRRLREVARMLLPTQGRDGMDYVLIGRREVTATLPFATLLRDFEVALAALHRKSR